MTKEEVSSQEVDRMIENICYLAVSQPWPSVQRNGYRGIVTKGFDGARAARVLCTVLSQIYRGSSTSMEISVGLEVLALDAGLVSHYAVRDALVDLQSSGWIYFKLGIQDKYVDGIRIEKGRPSFIRILPKPISGSLSPKCLPRVNLDAFTDDESGHAGWLAMARICFEYGDVRHPGGIRLGITEIANLTGMTYERMKRSLPKMARAGLCEKDGRKYVFNMIEHLTERDIYTDYKSRDRITKHNAKMNMRKKKQDEFIRVMSEPLDKSRPALIDLNDRDDDDEDRVMWSDRVSA